MLLQEGDEVIYARYAGAEVKIGETEFILMKEADVVGIKGSSVAEMKPLQVRTVVSC